MYQYPYGDSQQLNLDWIINKLIELEQSFVSGETAQLEEFANALISLTYIPTQAYNNSDIVFHDGHLYRCNTTIPAPGEVWDPSHWDQIMLGNTVANLVRAVAGMNSDHVFNESNVNGTHVTEALNALVEDIRYYDHKIQQKKNGAYTDVIPVEDTPSNNSDRLASSKAAYDLKGAISDLAASLSASTISDLATTKDHFVTFASAISVGGVTIPQYSKGVIVTSGSDATLYAIDTSGNLYVAYRSGANWVNGKNVTGVWKETQIFSSSSVVAYNTNIQLTDDYTKYNRLFIMLYDGSIGWQTRGVLDIGVTDLVRGGTISFPVYYGATAGYIQFTVSNSDTTILGVVSGSPTTLYITDVYGII